MHVSEIDKLLGAPARMAILATLADGQWWTFRDLREATGLADGNLHVQAAKLFEAGYLTTHKVSRGRRTVTTFQLTAIGRQKLRAHVQRLQTLVLQAPRHPKPQKPCERSSSHDGSRVW